MNRLQGAGLGLSLMALIGVGTITGNGVFAQEATSTPSTSVTTEATTEPEESERNAFIDAFAAQLGVTDEAQIDAAILGAYQQILAEKVAASDLTQEQADEILARVEAGELPFGKGGFFGGHHAGMRDGRGGPDGDRGGKMDRDAGKNATDDTSDDSTTPDVEATPAASSGIFA